VSPYAPARFINVVITVPVMTLWVECAEDRQSPNGGALCARRPNNEHDEEHHGARDDFYESSFSVNRVAIFLAAWL